MAWWSIFGETEFIATVVGTLVGGGITYGMQRSAATSERLRRDEDRREAHKTLGQSLLIKTLRINANLSDLKRYLEDSFAEARRDGFQGRPWQIVRPLASVPSHINYTTDELSLAFHLDEPDLFNRLSNLDAIHNVIDNFATFNSLKFNLNNALPGVVTDGKTVDSPISKEQALVLGPKMHEIDYLLGNLEARATQDTADADAALKQLVLILNKRLDLKIGVQPIPAQ